MRSQHHPEKEYALRHSQATEWGISVQHRLELEAVSRASVRTLTRLENEDWARLDFRSRVANTIAANHLETKADRYLSCSLKSFIYRCKGPQKHEFFAPNYCDLRFCQICAGRQYCRFLQKHSPVLEFLARNPRRGFRLRRITLTSINKNELSKSQIVAFNRQVKNTLAEVMRGVKGWGAIAALEVGFNNWNLHAHILIWCPYVAQKVLAEAWYEISGNQVVYITAEKGSGRRALGYLLKYTSKPPSDISENIALLEVAFHETRRLHCYGLFYNFSRDDPDHEKSKWSDCPECGAPLERVMGSWDVFEMPIKGLKFIGDCRRKGESKKWVN